MIRDGADAQASLAITGSVHIQSGSLHFQRHNAHLLQCVHAIQAFGNQGMVAVEHVGRADITHMVGSAVGLSSLNCLAHQSIVGNGCEIGGQMELGSPVGIGASTLADDQVIQVDVILDGAGGANTDDVLHTEEVEQLVAIDADGGHTHAGSHDGHLHALIVAGVTLHATNIVHQHGVLQEIFSDEFSTQRIAGHQHGLTKADFIQNIDMGSHCKIGHNKFLQK